MSSIISSQQLPVESTADVAAEWSDDVYNRDAPQPIVTTIVAGQTSMLQAYQTAAGVAASQSDPLAATGEYLDEIGSYEYGVHRQQSELDGAYRARLFNETTVDPADIVAACNTVLAPYTSTSCEYFEHSDAWFARETYLDIVGASNTSPILITTRNGLPPYLTTGGTVDVSLVTGNTAANGNAQTITVVMGPLVASNTGGLAAPVVTLTGTPVTATKIQITIVFGGTGAIAFNWTPDGVNFTLVQNFGSSAVLGNTGLTANFPAGNYITNSLYTSTPSGVSLNGSTGNGAYVGGGSLLLRSDATLHPVGWSSHVFANPFASQNYPDRYYALLPQRHSCGARAFSDAYGRIFWIVAPDISGIDTNVAALYTGYLDIVGATNTSPIAINTPYPLPSGLTSGATVTLALVLGNTAANGNFVITVTGPNSFTLNGSTGNGTYAGGGSVQTFLITYPPDGYFVASSFNLPGQLFVTTAAAGTLDPARAVALVRSGSGPTTVKFPAAGVANEQLAVVDIDSRAALNPITVSGNGNLLEDPDNPGTHVASILIRQNGGSAFWIWNGGTGQWDLYGHAGSFVWAIGATSYDVYSAVVGAVETLRAHSMRWGLSVDSRLGPNLVH